eukprot:2685736-Lingulodinium_polyedra.AAC.1
MPRSRAAPSCPSDPSLASSPPSELRAAGSALEADPSRAAGATAGLAGAQTAAAGRLSTNT